MDKIFQLQVIQESTFPYNLRPHLLNRANDVSAGKDFNNMRAYHTSQSVSSKRLHEIQPLASLPPPPGRNSIVVRIPVLVPARAKKG